MNTILIRDVLFNGNITNILIEGNIFKSLSADRDYKADMVIDGRSKAILAPFYNTHCHAAMTILRAYADDKPLFEWLNNHIWPYEATLTKEDVYAASRLAILEMIKSGSVFFNDMYFFIEETIRAVDEMGVRACIGLAFMDMTDDEEKERRFKFAKDWTRDKDDRVQIAIAPHAIYTVGKELLIRCAKEARENNMILHIHLSETKEERDNCIKEHGMSPVAYLDSLGILGPNVVAAHVVHVDDNDIRILKEREVVIAHNPCSNLKLSSGILPYAKYIKSECRMTLGTDGVSSNNNLDMLEEMKFAALVAKVQDGPETLKAEEIYQWASKNGAEAFSINAGEIAEGKLADAILVDLDNERFVPNYNLISNLVYSADSRSIDTVICNGRVLMQNGRVENEKEIIEDVRRVVMRKTAESNVTK